ncbi:alginate lyase family protein [Bythopirellula polymerisocia]|uniref:Alginate lyase n=1 Tax=Bythopirellula polymerisocia TaxID=2528003 RepID=A0A5C6CKH6_9BACT|nr:alginate lyase family protein [Bythopirellula polymerisocia]TWU24565.1 Alginate lyase [Bythopirellula polymerisocia]
MIRTASLLLTLLLFISSSSELVADTEPKLLIWEGTQLTKLKQDLDDPTPELQGAAKMLRQQAEDALGNKSYSVTYNAHVPPSGDKHDYASFGAYWWPDPSKPDGLPFIRRDGVTNYKQKKLGDKVHFGEFTKDVESLSLAYYYFEDERYARHAIHLIDDWFLNPETRMNPHLEYAQAVLGRNEGKNSGVIDTRDFMYVLESLELLKESPTYNQDFEDGLKSWFTEYLQWLQTSELGKKESQANNNHGTWYYVQAIRIALFLGKTELARELLDHVRDNLIPSQVATDGTQPEELARTNSFHYSIFNLQAMGILARMGESLNYDLWHYRDENGKGMQQAAEYLLPYVNGEADWPHEQISEYHVSPLTNQMFRMMSVRYAEPNWLNVSKKLLEGYPRFDSAMLVNAAYDGQNAE